MLRKCQSVRQPTNCECFTEPVVVLRLTCDLSKVGRMTRAQQAGRVPAIDLPVRLMVARTSAGMTQANLAAALGIARATVANYEAGKTPQRPTVMAWAMATGVDRQWLTTGVPEGEEPPSPDGDGGSEVRPKGFEPLTFWSGRLSLLPASMMEDAAA